MKTEEVVMSMGDLTQYLPIPIRSGKGWVLNWWNKLPKQWSILKDQRGKQLKYGNQGSDPSREMKCKDQQNRQLPIWYVTEADTPAHAKGSPWGPLQISQEDCWMHFILKITNFNSIN